MGAEDMARQALNVFRMRVLGATVERVDAGSRTLKDAINEAMRDWVSHVDSTYYLLGSVLGPHPYPLMVREFQSVIGQEARAQILARLGRLPDIAVACVGGGSNALGLFDAFVDDAGVRLVGVEAGGRGITPGEHAARFAGGAPGVLHGTRSLVLQDDDGNIMATPRCRRIDYASVGPNTRDSAREAAQKCVGRRSRGARRLPRLARHEGILPALSRRVRGVLRRGWIGCGGPAVLVNLRGVATRRRDGAAVERGRNPLQGASRS
jgi:tryptophan synthase beta chain